MGSKAHDVAAARHHAKHAIARLRPKRVAHARVSGLGNVRVRPVVAVASPNMHVELAPPLAVYIFFAQRRNTSIESVVDYAQEPQSGLSLTVLQRVYTALLLGRQAV